MACAHTKHLLQVFLFALVAGARDAARTSSSPHSTFESTVSRRAVNRTVIITQASCQFLQFADNWVAHVQLLGLHNFVVIAEDEVAENYLTERYPGHVISAALLTHQPLSQRSELAEFGTAEFAQLTCKRPAYLQAILQLGLSVLWLDLDVAVLVNPFMLLPRGKEYVGVDDSGTLDTEQDSANICTCFLFFRPTLRVHQLLQMWARSCRNSTSNDQVEWNTVFSIAERKTADYYIMPQRVFPDGLVEERRAASADDGKHGTRSPDTQPGWLHANYRVGHVRKREFFTHRRAWQAQQPDSYPSCAA